MTCDILIHANTIKEAQFECNGDCSNCEALELVNKHFSENKRRTKNGKTKESDFSNSTILPSMIEIMEKVGKI